MLAFWVGLLVGALAGLAFFSLLSFGLNEDEITQSAEQLDPSQVEF
jgi:hypothetical protein